MSIVTPCLNAGRFLGTAIRNVLAQDYPRLEHIVIDGGSTDDTLAVLERFPHLRWRSEPDRGQADAVNKGFALARGAILGWLNADDAYGPGAVGAAVRHLAAHPEVDLVYGVCRVEDERGRVLYVTRSGPPDVRRLIASDLPIPSPAVFFRRRVLERIGLLDSGLHLAMDFDYWVRAVRHCRLAYDPQIVGILRLHPETKSVRRYREVLPEVLTALERAWTDPIAPPPPSLRREAVAGAHVAAAIRAYLYGDRVLARRLAWTGLRGYPHPLRLRTAKALMIAVDAVLGTELFGLARGTWHRAERGVVDRWLGAARSRDRARSGLHG